jgi:hypothetical protein
MLGHLGAKLDKLHFNKILTYAKMEVDKDDRREANGGKMAKIWKRASYMCSHTVQ